MKAGLKQVRGNLEDDWYWVLRIEQEISTDAGKIISLKIPSISYQNIGDAAVKGLLETIAAAINATQENLSQLVATGDGYNYYLGRSHDDKTLYNIKPVGEDAPSISAGYLNRKHICCIKNVRDRFPDE